MGNFIKFLQDASGDMSSKRLGGLSCLTFGVILKILLIIYAAKRVTKTDFNDLDGAINTILYVAAGLLGAGLFDMFKKGKSDK